MIAIGKPLQLCLFDFRHGILQFADFSCGIAVYIGYHHVQPPCPDGYDEKKRYAIVVLQRCNAT